MPERPEEGAEAPFGSEDPAVIRDRLAAIVRSADDAIFSKDVNGVITSWNAAAERLYGYTEQEIVGRPISIIVPSDRPGEEREILGRILEGEDVRHYETKRVTRDGRIVDVSLSASPIHAGDGTIVGASVIARDITINKKSRRDVDRLAAIIQNSDDAIYSKDEHAIVDSWNPAAERLYGYSAEEAMGRHIRFLIPLDRKGEETDILYRILGGERIDHFETQRLTKSGELVDVSITVSPVRDENGRPVGASVIARDISDMNRLKELERGLDRMEFIARAAHELRTPITTLTGFASILSEDSLPDEQRAQVSAGIARQGEVLKSLINDLLDLTYVESGRYEMSFEPVSVDSVVADVLETAPPPSGKVLRTAIAPNTVAIADPARLGQVLVNLLTNAYKYGGGNIEISAQAERDRIVIRVADDGPGVPAEIRESLFEPFKRGHSGIEGSGLGLTITARLVEAQGGSVWVDAKAERTCFVVDLRRSPAVAD